MKCALRNPLCAPHADRLISELRYLRLTAIGRADARRGGRARVHASVSARRVERDIRDDDEKLEMLEDTLIALKTRVAALACLNEDARVRTTNAGSE